MGDKGDLGTRTHGIEDLCIAHYCPPESIHYRSGTKQPDGQVTHPTEVSQLLSLATVSLSNRHKPMKVVPSVTEMKVMNESDSMGSFSPWPT